MLHNAKRKRNPRRNSFGCLSSRAGIVEENNPALRRQAVLKLQKNGTPAVFHILCLVLKNDPSVVIRHEAAFLLGASKNKRSVSFLIAAALNDRSQLVRHEAIEALGDLKIKTKRVELVLQELATDPDPIIKETAVIALETLHL